MSDANPSAAPTEDRLGRRGLLAILARLATVGLAFLLQLTLARHLSPSGYGEFAFAISWVNLLVGFSMLGLDRASLRYPAEYLACGDVPRLRGFLRRSSQLGLLGSVTVAIGWLLVAMGFRARMTDGLFDCFLAAGCLVPIMAIAQIRDATLLGVGRVQQGLLGTGLRTGMFLVLLTVMISRGALLAPWQAVALQVVASLMSLLLSSWFLMRWKTGAQLQEHPEYETRGWLNVSLPLMAIVLMAFGINQSGILLTGLLLGTEASGLYAVAVRLCEVSLLGYHAVNTVIAPRFAALHATNQTDTLQHLLTRCVGVMTAATLGFGALLSLGGPFILSLFGPEFGSSFPILLILLAGVTVMVACGPVVYLLNMTGQQQICLATYTASVGVNVCLSLVLIPLAGMAGAACATALSLACCHIALAIVVRRRYGLIPYLTVSSLKQLRSAESSTVLPAPPPVLRRGLTHADIIRLLSGGGVLWCHSAAARQSISAQTCSRRGCSPVWVSSTGWFRPSRRPTSWNWASVLRLVCWLRAMHWPV